MYAVFIKFMHSNVFIIKLDFSGQTIFYTKSTSIMIQSRSSQLTGFYHIINLFNLFFSAMVTDCDSRHMCPVGGSYYSSDHNGRLQEEPEEEEGSNLHQGGETCCEGKEEKEKK